jgi:endogenous inhibitor of DNA gyrase (YacG/DUF329 family)
VPAHAWVQIRIERARLPGVRIVCPTCKAVIQDAPVDFAPRPFCSPRCKLVDLDNWLSERYALSEPIAPSLVDEDESASE